jgi:hypothetical protein
MPPVPDDNPYKAPQSASAPVVVSDDRSYALWRIRWALVILAVPAAMNYVCLHFVSAPHRILGGIAFSSPQVLTMFAAVNFVGSALTLVGTWYFGLRVFECAAVAGHHVFGGRLSKEEWLTAMYQALWRLPWAAAVGAVLWSAWCYLFFLDNHIGLFALSIVLGGLGHLVAAWVYLNVIASWYRLRRASMQSSGAAS